MVPGTTLMAIQWLIVVGAMLHGMVKDIRIISMPMVTMQQIVGIHMIMERMHTRDMTGHILRRMAHKLITSGCGLMVPGTTLMEIQWQQMFGIMPHGMVNITHIILTPMVTM